MTTPFHLSETYVHLGLGATAAPLFDFRWDDEYLEGYLRTYESDGDEGRLVMIGDTDSTWTSWERHPAGEEVVVLLSGRVTLIQELDGREEPAAMAPGQAIINPRDVWHTCDVHEPGRALYITPGRGTEHRPRSLRPSRDAEQSWP